MKTVSFSTHWGLSLSYVFQCICIFQWIRLECLRFIPVSLIWCYLVLFFILISNCSLLLYRNTIDFCLLILYSANLLNCFTSPNNNYINFIRFFYINNHATCKLGLFYFFFMLDFFLNCATQNLQYNVEKM